MIYLGIDFGLKNIGLSIAEGPLAQPLTQFKYQTNLQLFQKLKQIITDQQVKSIVLGLSEGKLAPKIKAFSKRLKNQINLPVYFQDETSSTKQAQVKLLEAHKPQKKRRLNHQAAATVILQNYLDDHPQP